MQKIKVHYPRQKLLSWLRDRFPDVDWTPLESELPPIVWRYRWNQIADRCGLPYTKMYMEQLDSQGKGPAAFQG